MGETERSYALEKLGRVVDEIGQPVLAASVRLERASDPARERPAQARITIDLERFSLEDVGRAWAAQGAGRKAVVQL